MVAKCGVPRYGIFAWGNAGFRPRMAKDADQAERKQKVAKEAKSRERWRRLPFDAGGVEDGAFDARAFVVPGAVVLLDFGDAGEADADAAGHRGFEGDLA